MFFENIDNNYFDYFYNQNNNNDDKYEKFYKGNMFDNEFIPYKNYTYIEPKINSEKEKLELKIMAHTFEINDYNLFLDLHPDNKEIFMKYKEACNKLKMCIDEYEKLYGPLSAYESNYQTFKWLDNPWPWDKKDGMYV